jgi:hypothetical protein
LAESQVVRDCEEKNYCIKSDLEGTINSMWDPNDYQNEVDGIDIAEGKFYQNTCINKYGTITPLHTQGSREPVITQEFMLPIEG